MRPDRQQSLIVYLKFFKDQFRIKIELISRYQFQLLKSIDQSESNKTIHGELFSFPAGDEASCSTIRSVSSVSFFSIENDSPLRLLVHHFDLCFDKKTSVPLFRTFMSDDEEADWLPTWYRISAWLDRFRCYFLLTPPSCPARPLTSLICITTMLLLPLCLRADEAAMPRFNTRSRYEQTHAVDIRICSFLLINIARSMMFVQRISVE